MPRQRQPSARDGAVPPPLIASLVAALRSEAWDEARRLLKENSSLVDPDVGAHVGRAVATEEANGRVRSTNIHLLTDSERDFGAWMESHAIDIAEDEYRSLFARAAEVGVDAAFWEAGKVTAGKEVQRLRDAAESTHLSDDSIAELEDSQTPAALDDWRLMAAHPEFSRAPLPLQQQILEELAELISMQLGFTGEAALADEYVRVSEQLVATNDEGSDTLAGHLQTLGNAWKTTFEIAGRLDALDKAVATYRDAVAASRDRKRPAGLSSLGTALAMRYEFSRARADLDEAIAALEAARSAESARDVNNLAIALLHRGARSRSRRDLDRAIDLLTAQVKWSRDPATLNNLATALAQRHERFHAVADLRRARRALRDALAATPRGSPDRPGRLSNLLRALAGPRPSPRMAGEARQTIEEIRALPADANPSGVVAALRTWGQWAAARGDWEQAAVAFDRGVRVLGELVARQSSAALKEDWIRHATGIASDAAYAQARHGDGAAAALSFERGRAILLREDLRRAHGDAAPTVETFDDLQRAADRSPLVLLASRRWGGLAIVVRATRAPEIVWFPKLTEDALAARVQRYLAAYSTRAASPHAWEAAIVATTKWLWQAGIGRLLSAIADSRAVVVAAGGLGLMPLHAAWTPDASVPARKRYLLDSLTMTYAPSIASLLFARRQAESAVAEGLAAVADPYAPRQPRLPLAVKEVTTVARHFPRQTLLQRRDATRARVLAALREHGVWHFACHGFAAYDMAETGLVLADDEMLTVRDISELGSIGGHVRLAVLSACETAVADGSVPDEAIGLPTAMIRAGVAATVGSLWSVAAGASTAVLFARFYELWREQQLDPADALREAQRWTRDSTNGEKRKHFPRLVAPGDGIAKRDVDVWASARAHRAPYFWAPFVYVGA
jgi:CHAT domain-containing protein